MNRDSSPPSNLRDRAEGLMLGLACGDALGRPVEFRTPAGIEREHDRLTEMIGDGTHNQPAGTITDDTEMALCIARSVRERGTFDPVDIADRFVAWYESSPFDIGGMTRRALSRIREGESWEQAGRNTWEASSEGSNAGNGSVMRCAPLAIAYADSPDALIRTSVDSSRITHADPRCTYGCAILNLTIAAAIRGSDAPLAEALAVLSDDVVKPVDNGHDEVAFEATGSATTPEREVPKELFEALRGVPDEIDESTLSNSGYVLDTLQTALYDGLTAASVEKAIVRAVNRGGDADTIGSVAGAVAGARFGTASIPDRWLVEIDAFDELVSLSRSLWTRTYQFD